MIRVLAFVCVGILVSCSGDPEPVECSISNLAPELMLVEPASGCGIADGKIVITATGGSPAYQFQLPGKPFQTTGEFTGLMPGIYSFIVRDKNNCEVQLSNITLMAADVSFTADVTDNTLCVGGNGEIAISMTGGTPPFQFRIGTESFSSASTFSGLRSGNYMLTVKDNADCVAELMVNVGQGITNTSWQTEILPIIQSACATSGCHDGVSRTDLRVYANAKSNAALIKTYTQNGYMPFEGTITAQQKARIACWIDEGTLEN